MKVFISQGIIRTIIDSALENPDKEFFYFLKGEKKGNNCKISGLYYTHLTSSKFRVSAITPFYQDMHDVIGTSHSHPSGNAHPSETDLKTFSRFPVNCICNGEIIRFFDNAGNEITEIKYTDDEFESIPAFHHGESISFTPKNRLWIYAALAIILFLLFSWTLWYLF